MRARRRRGRVVAAALLAGLAPPAAAGPHPAERGDGAEPGWIADWLVVGRVGRGGRSPVHTDAVEARLVAGTWTTPAAGDTVAGPDGTPRTWEAAAAGDDGWLAHAALRGGWAAARVELEAPRTALLEVAGHSAVRVNGEPRCGDPYATGWVRVPVRLEAGSNELLFRVGRGRVRARLVEPPAPIFLEMRDVTVPDVVRGERPGERLMGVLVVNTTGEPRRGLIVETRGPQVEWCASQVGTVAPLGRLKTPVAVRPRRPVEGDAVEVQLRLLDSSDRRVLHERTLSLPARGPDENHRVTFRSAIDGSIQYYALNPARPRGEDDPAPGLVLSLHGAAVEATSQANAYAGRPWCHLVAPTNRRPFGFDWEDWGRLDAMEVLELATSRLATDPARTWLTGHSMGGHGTWHLGVTFPDRFAAIAPSAGWASFWSYTGAAELDDAAASVEEILRRAANPSRTETLVRNTLQHGVYILHGDRDDNVPVSEARRMRELLAGFHRDFAYYERVGAGHWWGNACVDWEPLFEFLRFRTRPAPADVPRVEFRTASPGVSARCHWVTVETQDRPLRLSTVDLRLDPETRRVEGTTDNVRRLTLDVAHLEAGAPLQVKIDGETPGEVAWPAGAPVVRLVRDDDAWRVDDGRPDPARKGPRRAGPFKDVFRHGVVLVPGTAGTDEENAWALARARFDAETFWYRGNGVMEVIADTAFDPARHPDRNVVLYGNADTNHLWAALLGDSPVRVRRGRVEVGDRVLEGDDLACLLIRPRAGSDVACVGAVAGTGGPGARLTDGLPYFVSGVAYPDWVVIGAEMLADGVDGVRAAGFFGEDWGLSARDSAWREPASR
ncbi:MAG: prolyl oligopeptidase family serine peptidase [Planctomycetota bacterium]